MTRAPSGSARFASSCPTGKPSTAGTPRREGGLAQDVDREEPAVVAAGELSEGEPGDALEGAREPQLGEAAIDPVRLLPHVLEEEDRPVEPGRVRRPGQVREDRRVPPRSGPVARPGRIVRAATRPAPGAGTSQAPGRGAILEEERLEVARPRRPAPDRAG